VAREAGTESAGGRERGSLVEKPSSADIYTPYQRPKRLNDGHRLANGDAEVVEYMRNKVTAVSIEACRRGQLLKYRAQRPSIVR
jgi:hypothetical protein